MFMKYDMVLVHNRLVEREATLLCGVEALVEGRISGCVLRTKKGCDANVVVCVRSCASSQLR